MKVIAFNGSPRKDGNTSILVRKVFEPIEAAGIATELVSLAGVRLRGCTACYRCGKNKDGKCVITDDPINDYIEMVRAADALILASPVYFTDVTAEMKAFIDRVGYVGKANGNLYRRKVGAAVVAVRRGGQIHTYDTLNHFFGIMEMIVPGSTYWTFGVGREIGQVEQDEEGLRTMTALGENIAWLLKKLHA